MPTDTDIRLRSRLDANQRDREQMCRSVLALDPHYSDVRPRHPAGGPDGGRDIEAIFDGDRMAYGAVGFHNGANDSDEQKKRIRTKFSSDLASALAAKPDLKVFAFLTNLDFTMGEQSKMKDEARQGGIEHCDILDRERLRIELDSPGGFFIRFQYLGIPLSEAEQASFLAHYGDRIQEVVSTGFQRIERTLSRILFLQEAAEVLDGIFVRFHLKKSYRADEIGHFRAFVHIFLREVKHDIWMILFGSSDKSNRFYPDQKDEKKNKPAGIAHGISRGQWEQYLKLPAHDDEEHENETASAAAEAGEGENEKRRFVYAGCGGGAGIDPVSSIFTHYSHDDPLVRYRPRLQLRDLKDCMLVPILNLSLAEKLHSIEVFANGYKLADIGPNEFTIDRSSYKAEMPDAFTPDELADPWVRIRPADGSTVFEIRFTETTSRWMHDHEETHDTPAPKTI
jgi:hypothetical protein